MLKTLEQVYGITTKVVSELSAVEAIVSKPTKPVVVTSGGGIPGMDGLDGADGIDGAFIPLPGPQGIQGIAGIAGRAGLDGMDGIDGYDGINGNPGSTGAAGASGRPGMDGLDGLDGIDGNPGPIGLRGPVGISGPPGMDGDDAGNEAVAYGMNSNQPSSIIGPLNVSGNITAPVATIAQLAATNIAVANSFNFNGGEVVMFLSGGVAVGTGVDPGSNNIQAAGNIQAATFGTSGTWIPTDASGASLVFTSVTATYIKIGKICYINFTLTYPSTVSIATAIISGLPFTAASSPANTVFSLGRSGSTIAYPISALGSASALTIFFVNDFTGAAQTNANMTLTNLIISGWYPTT